LRKYAGWAEQIAPAYAREFYDFQFDFPETRAFFERYAHKKRRLPRPTAGRTGAGAGGLLTGNLP
jgi:hypothetical protein